MANTDFYGNDCEAAVTVYTKLLFVTAGTTFLQLGVCLLSRLSESLSSVMWEGGRMCLVLRACFYWTLMMGWIRSVSNLLGVGKSITCMLG